jgi:hypothetical protein
MSETLQGFLLSGNWKMTQKETQLIKSTNTATLIINTNLLIYQLHNINAGIYVVPGHSRM